MLFLPKAFLIAKIQHLGQKLQINFTVITFWSALYLKTMNFHNIHMLDFIVYKCDGFFFLKETLALIVHREKEKKNRRDLRIE